MFHICSLSYDVGIPCNSDMNTTQYNQSINDEIFVTKRYRFDPVINQCVPFGYLGCEGNWNNFYTENLCALRCSELIFFI